VSIWDRWELKGFGKGTLQDMMTKLEEMYKGLSVVDVLRANANVF